MFPRFIHQILAFYPQIYLRLLQLTKRGSIEKRVFLSFLRSGDVVFDVGANRGHFTQLYSEIVRSHGKVYAFEPIPSTFKLLETKMAGCKNCQLYNVALGNSVGSANLSIPGSDDGQASLRVHNNGSWAKAEELHTYKCAMTKIDEIAKNLSRLNFIKCDVEGAELLVLQGAYNTLQRLSPILFLEVCQEWTLAFDYTPENLVNFLKERGYTNLFIVNNGIHPLNHISEINGSVNLLCSKNSLPSNVLEA